MGLTELIDVYLPNGQEELSQETHKRLRMSSERRDKEERRSEN